MKRSVWTPDARVLCCTCHGPKNLRDGKDLPAKTWAEFNSPPDTSGPLGRETTCTECGDAVWLYDVDVALLNNLRAGLPRTWNARLDQTGGMNVALNFEVNGKSYTIFSDEEDDTFTNVILTRRTTNEHEEYDYENLGTILCDPKDVVYAVTMDM